ncbi:hypothetical protein MAR621_02598 [Maribacter dokdonensis]|uniref:hypothetical protein n=1 Tax=Maribacter dokdonensis TaxID=320912 RepID=UPI001B2B943E|nr:hypothetical protein [Maribacter dokdonensis]CAG2531946.1 hypothetical protein MAR621_02598 [Maribacter dokdonensis]
MKTNQEILDEFGKILISDVFDKGYEIIKNDISDLAETEGYEKLFGNMNNDQKMEIEKFTKEILEGVLFQFLKIFEENKQFKLLYEKENIQVNLVKISEMLKAEPIIEDGWINRFSEFKFSDNK